ncbi:MAG TPA: ABC transporter ATP-binding protein/permease, partial [Planctomycetota bacterium]
AFVRVLLWAPRVVFLERPGAGLSTEQLDQALDLFAATSIAVISIAAAVDAHRFYDAVLTLKNDGGWQWAPLHAGS